MEIAAEICSGLLFAAFVLAFVFTPGRVGKPREPLTPDIMVYQGVLAVVAFVPFIALILN